MFARLSAITVDLIIVLRHTQFVCNLMTCWYNWDTSQDDQRTTTPPPWPGPLDTTTTQAEDARANINVVLSTAYRQQQHGQDQLMSTLPPRHDTTTPGQTSKCSEEILLLSYQVLAHYEMCS